jgi:Glycosyl transferases group 1
MVKICFISYYGLRESLLCASNSLEKLGYEITNFSLMEHERNENKDKAYDMLIETINTNKIDVVLWWYIGLETDKFRYIVENTNIKHMFYNWDDPNGWIERDIMGKAKYFNCVFTCCKGIINRYLEHGTKNVFHLLPGYDPTVNYIIVNDVLNEYDCDISIVCTQLYENNLSDMNQYINRKELIDNIYKNRSKYKFHVYGPPFLKELYPDCYKKQIPYSDLNHVFNNSKINICTHTHCQFEKYANERTVLILGSGGLLYVDKVKGNNELFEDKEDCVYIDKENYIEQICDILQNYDEYLDIRNNGKEKSNKYTWTKWGEFIHNNYLKVMDTILPINPSHLINHDGSVHTFENGDDSWDSTQLTENLKKLEGNENIEFFSTDNTEINKAEKKYKLKKADSSEDDSPLIKTHKVDLNNGKDTKKIKINIEIDQEKFKDKNVEINIKF